MNKEKSRKGKKKQEEKEDSSHHEIIEEVLSISGPASNDEDDEKKVEKPAKKTVKAKNKKEQVSQSIGNDTVPPGWRKEVVVRKSGKTAGQHDLYFYSPDGTKLRSKPDVVSYISKKNLPLKIEQFNFSKEIVSKKDGGKAVKRKSISATKQNKEESVKDSQKEEVAKPAPKPPKNVGRKNLPAVNSVSKKKEDSNAKKDTDVKDTEEAPRKLEVFQVRPPKKRRTRF